jgi:hypothetical protein
MREVTHQFPQERSRYSFEKIGRKKTILWHIQVAYTGFEFCEAQESLSDSCRKDERMGRTSVAAPHAWYSCYDMGMYDVCMNAEGIGCNEAMTYRQC